MMCVHEFSLESALTFQRIQGLASLLSQQAMELEHLWKTYCRLVGATEEDVEVEGFPADFDIIMIGKFKTTRHKVEEFIRGLGSFVNTQFEQVSVNNRPALLDLIGQMFLEAATRLQKIVVERNSNNEQVDESDLLPPVMPHELVKYSGVSFCSVVRKQTRRLEAAQFTPEQIEAIENDHQKLVRAYHAEKPLKSELDSFNHRTSFFESWNRLRIRFPNLYKFAGGLASVFPGTATVEADFSKIKREKDVFRQSLSDFGLQCVLHCEQRKKIEKVWELL